MRYYDLSITGATGAQSSFTLSSLGDDGNFNPSALNIEFDATVYTNAVPQTLTTVRIWGVPLRSSAGLPGIDQASDLNKAKITLKAGMSKGLPLAKPAYRGPILNGTIFQAFGNWINTDMTIDLVVSPTGSQYTVPQPGQIFLVLNWRKGQMLADALKTDLTTAYPGYTLKINISDKLVATQDFVGCYNDIETFSAVVKAQSLNLIKTSGYAGVDVVFNPDNSIFVNDGTVAPQSVKQLLFEDLIGQPTWFGPGQVQFNCPVRADIAVLDQIKFPQLRATQTAAELSNQTQDKSSFQGTFTVNLVRHVGNFRQPAAQSWITTFNAFSNDQAGVSAAIAGGQ